MCNGYDNPPETLTETRPKARKQHRCCECGLPIPVGTVYVHTWGVWNREPNTYKQHGECRALLQWISDTFCDGEMWSFTTLTDELGEYGPGIYADDDPAKPDAVMAHAWWAAIQDQYGSVIP